MVSLLILTTVFGIANLVLEDTVERIYHGNAFAEHWHGLFLIRGENVVLLGEIVRLPVRSFSYGLPIALLRRISIKRMTSHYDKSIISFWIHIIKTTLLREKFARISRQRFCMNKKGSAKKAARETGIDGNIAVTLVFLVMACIL